MSVSMTTLAPTLLIDSRAASAARVRPQVHRIALALTILAVILRAPFWTVPVQCDEAGAYLLYVCQPERPLLSFLTHYAGPSHQGLHELCVILLAKITGLAFPWLRLPALIGGVALVPLTYMFARRIADHKAGVLAALMMACSTWSIEYSLSARGYTIATCLMLAGIVMLLGRKPYPHASRTRLLIAGLLMGMAVYTIHTTVYLLAALAAWAVVGDRRMLKPVACVCLAASASAAVMFAPLMLGGDLGAVLTNKFIAPRSFAELAGLLPQYAPTYIDVFAGGVMPAAVLGVLAAVGAAAAWRSDNRAARLPLMVLALLPLVVAAQRALPFPRALMFAQPFVYTLAAMGVLQVAVWIGANGERCRSAAAVSAAGIVMVTSAAALVAADPYPTAQPDSRPDLRRVADAIVRTTAGDEPIFAQESLNPVLQYYLRCAGRRDQPVCRPSPRYAHAVLVWKPKAGLSDEMQAGLGGFTHGDVLFEDKQVQVMRVRRRRPKQFTNHQSQIIDFPS